MFNPGKLLRRELYLILVLLVYLIFELVAAFDLFIWLDEAFTLNTTEGSLYYAVKNAVIFEGQPPVYFALLSLWRNLNASIYFARLFSILCILLSILIVYRISIRHLKFLDPIFPVLLFTFNPVIIWAGLEIRVYPLIVLFSALIILQFLNTYLNSGKLHYKRNRAGFIVIAILAVNTQYYLGLLLLSNFIFLVISQKRKAAIHYFIDMMAPVLSLFVYIPFLPDQLKGHISTEEVAKLFPDSFLFFLKHLKNYLFPFPRILNINNAWLYLVLLVLLAFLARKNFRKMYTYIISGKNYFFLGGAIVLLLFILLYKIVGSFNLTNKHTILLVVPLIMPFILLINFIQSRKIRILFVILIVFVYLTKVPIVINNQKRQKELIDLGKYISNNEDSRAPVLFYRGEISLVYKYTDHYDPDIELYSIPAPIDYESPYYHCDWFIKDTLEIEKFFSQFRQGEVLWLVSSEERKQEDIGLFGKLGCEINYSMLNNHIDKNFHILEDRSFNNMFLLRKIVKRE